MKATKKEGIDITQEDGTPLRSGYMFYWDAQLSRILIEEARKFCPNANFKQEKNDDFTTCFRYNSERGVELCGSSDSLENRKVRIPQEDLKDFIDAIEQLHQKSEQPGIPTDNKNFMRDFMVPNPLVMKSAWRVTTGFYRHLLVLWGYTASASDAVVLPLTPTSAKWEDASQRKDLKELLESAGLVAKSCFNWGKFFRYVGYALLILLLLLFLFFAVAAITGHKCNVCGKETALSLKNFPYTCECCDKPEKDCSCENEPVKVEKCPVCGSELKDGKCPEGHVVPPVETCPVCGSELKDGKCPKSHPIRPVKKCSVCGSELKDGKCPKDHVAPPVETCPVCGSELKDGKCPKGHPTRPVEKCSICGGELKYGKCPKGHPTPIVEKCPVCGSELKDGKCPEGHVVPPVETCPVCGRELKDGKCPKGHPIRPVEKCSICGSELKDGKCPKGHVAPPVENCPVCESELKDGKCPERHPTCPVEKCSICGSELKDGKCPKGHHPIAPIVEKCPVCGRELKDGKCPKGHPIVPPPSPEILDYTFTVKLEQKNVNGDLVNATFTAVPDKSMGDVEYKVESWSVNGEVQKPGENMKNFTTELSYKKRYEITAAVTVNGKEQKVLPYQWNSVDTPVWMITRVGNHDNEYQMICTNSSNTEFKVEKWNSPVFKDAKGNDVTGKFTPAAPRPIDDNKVLFSWRQDYMGEYVLELEANVGVASNGGKAETVSVKNTFAFVNGSMANALISLKFTNAKGRIYHCLATATDGSQHSGTAFAVTDKLLLTNYHVAVGSIPEYYDNKGNERKVDSAKPLILSNEKGIYYAKVLNSDRATDMALLKLCDKNGNETDKTLPYYFKVSEKAPELNARVFSAGYPAGTTRFGEPAFVDGKIENCVDDGSRGNIILHFSDIQPGYSGGPLVYMDNESEVAGVNSSGIVTGTPLKKGVKLATSAAEIRKKFPEIFEARH